MSETNNKEPTLSRGWIAAGLVVLIAINLYVVFSSGLLTQRAMRILWFHCDIRHWPSWYALNLWVIAIGLFLSLLFRQPSTLKKCNAFYSSKKWLQFKSDLKNTDANQAIVRFLVRRRHGKALLQHWLRLWSRFTPDRYSKVILLVTFAVVCCIVFAKASFMIGLRTFLWQIWRRPAYLFTHWIYIPFFYGPWTYFFFNGRMSWRMINAPALALLLIILLLRWNAKIKQRRRASK